MNTVAIIPARGGSKGIPDKNIININGKPLINFSIEHAMESALIDRIIVSTDSEEIAEVAIKAGAEVPFIRPTKLAEDDVLDLPVFDHAINFLEQNDKYICDTVVHLRPTAPFRKTGWIDQAIQLLLSSPSADSIRSVSEVRQHPYRMFRINQSDFLIPIHSEINEPYLLRRQDLPPIYYYNCVLDVTRYNTIMKLKSMTGKRIKSMVIDSEEVIDIDTPLDLEIFKKVFYTKL